MLAASDVSAAVVVRDGRNIGNFLAVVRTFFFHVAYRARISLMVWAIGRLFVRLKRRGSTREGEEDLVLRDES